MNFVLNGKEYELDLFDVDVAENFDKAFLEFSEINSVRFCSNF